MNGNDFDDDFDDDVDYDSPEDDQEEDENEHHKGFCKDCGEYLYDCNCDPDFWD